MGTCHKSVILVPSTVSSCSGCGRLFICLLKPQSSIVLFFVAVYNTLLYFLAAVFSPFLSLQMEYLPTPEIFNLHQQDLPLEMALPFQRIETQKPKPTTATAKVTTKAGSKCKVVEVSDSSKKSSSRKRKQPGSPKPTLFRSVGT